MAPLVERTLEPDLTAPAAARGLVRELAVADECRRNVELIVSELVSNAVVHGQSAADDAALLLRVECEGGRVHGEICDGGSGFDWEPSDPDLSEPGGLGLMVVDQLASRWGVRRNGATCVWFVCADAG